MAIGRSDKGARTPTAISDTEMQQPPQSQHDQAPEMNRPRIWDKNNYGFWLLVCIVISLLFSIVYRALT